MRKRKELGQIDHAIQRVGQRYGLKLSVGDMKRIANIIRAGGRGRQSEGGERQFLHTISTRLSVWKVLYGEHWVIVAYDKNRHNVATALPPDWTPDWKERAS